MSGVYTIDPGCPRIEPFTVWCDVDNGQWVVFQKRKNGEVNFFRRWDDYVNGFGDPKWEHWLGLEKIHCLTAATCRAEVRVDLCNYKGNKSYAHYNFFSVNNNRTNYRLDVGAYSGDAGDALNAVACGGSININLTRGPSQLLTETTTHTVKAAAMVVCLLRVHRPQWTAQQLQSLGPVFQRPQKHRDEASQTRWTDRPYANEHLGTLHTHVSKGTCGH